MINNDTIVALATPSGAGAIAVIRLSGATAIQIASEIFSSVSKKKLSEQATHTVHLGNIVNEDRIFDEVLITVFKNPNSYTGENVVEISCHGSAFIQQEIIQLCLRKGCRMAQAGEFTLRAFLNGKMDLSQAEAVADLIASDSAASHQLAIQQMRGGFSNEIRLLREELLNFASLIELELDFAEEDVELSEFSDEIEGWVIAEFSKAGLDTAKSILEQDVADFVKRTDLEEETIIDVLRILKEEFEESHIFKVYYKQFMADTIRLNKVLRELNISIDRAVDFLES